MEQITEGFFEEFEISTVGKIFLAGIAMSALGKPSNIKVRGTPNEIETVKKALMASKALQDELNRPGASVQSIMDRLHLKNISAEEFQQRLGVPWPL